MPTTPACRNPRPRVQPPVPPKIETRPTVSETPGNRRFEDTHAAAGSRRRRCTGTGRYQRNGHYLPQIRAQPAVPVAPVTRPPRDTLTTAEPRRYQRTGTHRCQRNHHNPPQIRAQPAIPVTPATQQPEDTQPSATCRASPDRPHAPDHPRTQMPYTLRVVRRVACATSATGRSKTSASAASVYGIMYGALVRPR